MNSIAIEMEKTDFTGGDIINGRVKLHLEKSMPSRGIRIRFHGYEKSWFQKGSGKNRHTYSEKHPLFHDEVTLSGKPALGALEILEDAVKGFFSSDRYEVIHPGDYSYAFTYKLPPDIPADYERGRSRIAYEIEAYIDIPLRIDIRDKKKLTVYETYDENRIRPIQGRSSKNFLFDSDGALDMHVTLDKNMFFPGDEMKGMLKLTNRSRKKIDAINVWLYHTTDLIAKRRSHTDFDSIKLLRIPNPGIPANCEAEVDLDFHIPRDLYCSISTSKLVKVRYEIAVSLDIPWALDPEALVPVTILEKAGMPSGKKST